MGSFGDSYLVGVFFFHLKMIFFLTVRVGGGVVLKEEVKKVQVEKPNLGDRHHDGGKLLHLHSYTLSLFLKKNQF
jgi:hypothetical protein